MRSAIGRITRCTHPGILRAGAGSLLATAVLVLTGCSDDPPDNAGGNPPTSSPTSDPGTPSGAPSSQPTTGGPLPTASTPTLKPLPTPTKPWPTPKVTGEPASDAPLAQRVRFRIAKQVQVAAGKAAPTTVKCPGIDRADESGKHTLTCTVTYAGKALTGTLVIDAERYRAKFAFTSKSVAIVRPKVVDAVLRAAPGAAKVTCTMDQVTVVEHTGDGISCDVTTTANAVQPYRARVSGDGKVEVAKA